MTMSCAKWWKRRLEEFRSLQWLAFFVILSLPFSSFAQGTATNATLIKIGLARHVAAEHVHANNQPYQWCYLDHMILYDIDGSPNGYAFIFGRAESRFSGPPALRQHITDRTAAAPAKQGQKAQPSVDNDLFAFDDLATVITGATTESPLILRHFRGVPEFWIQAVRLDASRRGGASEATQVVMVTPMDFRLVTTEAKATAVGEPTRQSASIPLAASVETIAIHSKKAVRISALQQRAEERQARTRRRFESMTPAQKKRTEAARHERRDFLRRQWNSKRARWQQTHAEEEKQK